MERGSEPARSAFLGAIVAWSSDPSIDALVHAAATYPEAGVEQRMARFLAQAQTAQWYVGEAAKRDDPYLAGWAASRLALFACRLVLAHNRVLYPYHKWLLRTVAEVPDRPDDFVDLVRALAIERTPAAAEAVVMSLLLFREWPQAPAGWSTSSCWTASGTGSTVSRRSTISDRARLVRIDIGFRPESTHPRPTCHHTGSSTAVRDASLPGMAAGICGVAAEDAAEAPPT